ncbi:hypothetical protein KSC_106290 [Ktedonobacter sp. SOSP1-52]|nr:hypothetical protein KSC_106290 [Ktedonobacter sp. SOSP1-52]
MRENKSILLFLHHIKSAEVVFDMMYVELAEKESEIGQVVKGAFVRYCQLGSVAEHCAKMAS